MLSILVVIQYVLSVLEIVVLVLLGVAFTTLFERRVLANYQRRQGPNNVGFWGLLQPFADGAKLVFKEIVDVFGASTDIFTIAPILALSLAELLWFVIAVTSDYILLNYIFSILSLFIVLSLSAVPSMLVGWASHSRYALLGALRAAAQTISYEVILALNLVPIMLFTSSFSLQEIYELDSWLIFSFTPVFIIHLICTLAEGYRTPFDLPEAEGELVAGYIVEVSSVEFAEFFIAEYANLLSSTLFIVQLFFGGASSPAILANIIPAGIFWLFLKTFIVFYIILTIRALLPRYRYDQLMHFCWYTALPVVLLLVFFYFIIGMLLS
jgi:NADH-quinone oxidoreductase subunit H